MRRGTSAALAWCVVFLVACRSQPAPVAADVERYLHQAAQWASLERETKQTVDRILRTEFADEGEVARQIADNRPPVEAHLRDIRGYTPESPALRAVHGEYVRAWERLLEGYRAIEDGFATGQYGRVSTGRAAMVAWPQAIVNVARQLRTLASETGAHVPAVPATIPPVSA